MAVIDLLLAKVNKPNPHQKGFDEFIAQSVQLNKQRLINKINELPNVDPVYIIESFVCHIIKAAFAHKTQSEILDDIAGGAIFKLNTQLTFAFVSELNGLDKAVR